MIIVVCGSEKTFMAYVKKHGAIIMIIVGGKQLKYIATPFRGKNGKNYWHRSWNN